MKAPPRSPAYPAFGLTLVVNHACNLRCRYCYTGAKFHSPLPVPLGERAIQRALASLEPGGTLQLGFFGGEPLIEAGRILDWMQIARRAARSQGKAVRFNLTTNGTVTDPRAQALLLDPDLELAVSCDGTPSQHDRHRRDAQGRGSFSTVAATLRHLIAADRAFSVVMVVRPDTVGELSAGLRHLREMGVARFTLSLDVWTPWTEIDLLHLGEAVEAAADLWRDWLPGVSIDWFDTRIAALAGLATAGPETRCGFGAGEIAVAPSGRLYPCERLVGEDAGDHPLQLPGRVDDGDPDFLALRAPCGGIGAPGVGSTCEGCRCSNYLLTGSTRREGRLLEVLDRAVHQALERLISPDPYVARPRERTPLLPFEPLSPLSP